MRIKILNAVIISIFLLLAVFLFNMQIIQGANFKSLSDKNCMRLISQPGARGRILDKNGLVLVGNSISYDLQILPQEKTELNRTLSAVASVLNIGFEELKSRYKKNYLAPFIPVTVAKKINSKKAIVLGELKSDYNSIIIQPCSIRYYPFGNLASHVIGYLNQIDQWRLSKLDDYGYKIKDTVGFGGIEEKYDYYLRQIEGALSVEVDHRGKFIRVLGFRPAQDGKDIQLTLYINLQRIVEAALQDKKGAVVIMNPYTGEILAMASAPGFSPSEFLNDPNSVMKNISADALINKAISSVYASGSVFKLVSAYAGLERGKVDSFTTYVCAKTMRVGNRDFGCWDRHNEENLANAIAHSCNIYFYKVGLLLGAQAIHDYALKFGFAKTTGVDLPYEAAGVIPDPLWKKINKRQDWYDGDTANFVIGQGYMLVSVIQTARFIAVFANRGTLVTPFMVKAIGGKDIRKSQTRLTSAAIKRDILNQVRQHLRGVVSNPEGTANLLADLPVAVAGKTGTAQFSNNQTHGWFAGFFPFDNPGFVICALIEKNGTGAAASALVKQIIAGMILEKMMI